MKIVLHSLKYLPNPLLYRTIDSMPLEIGKIMLSIAGCSVERIENALKGNVHRSDGIRSGIPSWRGISELRDITN